jgi:chemotaxis protein MotB
MKLKLLAAIVLCGVLMSSCVSKKTLEALQSDYDLANQEIGKLGVDLNKQMSLVTQCEQEKEGLRGDLRTANNTLKLKDEQINDLKAQIQDLRQLRDKQVEQVGDLTILSQSANENIKETLGQLERKDQYINLLSAAKTKADSINLALAVNLKSVLSDGIADDDVEIKVDKTVVFINLSDKMLYNSGSADLTPRANDVLGKIAQIVQSRPDFEVMVEGYTDNQPISRACFKDNWDLSVVRATSVVRVLQDNYNIDPNRLIAAGRGEYNALASNDTFEGRSTNRRTRIIILPKLDQFYDLLNPDIVPN